MQSLKKIHAWAQMKVPLSLHLRLYTQKPFLCGIHVIHNINIFLSKKSSNNFIKTLTSDKENLSIEENNANNGIHNIIKRGATT